MLLAACPDPSIRDGTKALDAAQKALSLAKGPNEQATLAAAYAELGQFDTAVDWQVKAIAAAPETNKDQYRHLVTPFDQPTPFALRAEYERRLKLYQDRKPYRFE
jgi:tetratricopeptide (TPR) repeat protein